jgi:hypothetical protein
MCKKAIMDFVNIGVIFSFNVNIVPYSTSSLYVYWEFVENAGTLMSHISRFLSHLL